MTSSATPEPSAGASDKPVAPPDSASLAPYSLQDLTRYFLRLGTFGFGGPIGAVIFKRP